MLLRAERQQPNRANEQDAVELSVRVRSERMDEERRNRGARGEAGKSGRAAEATAKSRGSLSLNHNDSPTLNAPEITSSQVISPVQGAPAIAHPGLPVQSLTRSFLSRLRMLPGLSATWLQPKPKSKNATGDKRWQSRKLVSTG